MTRFTTSIRAEDVLDVTPELIWDVLRDPDLLAELTPLVDRITVQHAIGDRQAGDTELWTWCLAGVSALGMTAAPCFTERMQFSGLGGITFVHDPEVTEPERAGAAGRYVVSPDPGGGAHLRIDIAVHVDLPLPRLMAGAVERVMQATLKAGGERFAARLIDHLGGVGRRGMAITRVEAADVTAILGPVLSVG